MNLIRVPAALLVSVWLLSAAGTDKPSPIAFHMRSLPTVALPVPGWEKTPPPAEQVGKTFSASSAKPVGAVTHNPGTAAPAAHPGFAAQTGIACFYGDGSQGKLTSSGERFDNRKLTAAHATYPLGSHVRVTNLASGKSVTVVVTDRGSFGDGRIINVSHRAAADLGFVKAGTAPVRVERITESSVSE